MEWCKLYATFATDPKVLGLSDKAFRRYVEAMCYATLHETDGYAMWKDDRVSQELKGMGLVDPDGRLHGWLNRQRSIAEHQAIKEARAIAGAKGAAKRWHGKRDGKHMAEVELEVEVEVEQPTSKTERSSVRNERPDDDQAYLAERLESANGQRLSFAALQKLNSKYGHVAVSDALRAAHGFPPEAGIGKLYAYVEAICKDKVSV